MLIGFNGWVIFKCIVIHTSTWIQFRVSRSLENHLKNFSTFLASNRIVRAVLCNHLNYKLQELMLYFSFENLIFKNIVSIVLFRSCCFDFIISIVLFNFLFQSCCINCIVPIVLFQLYCFNRVVSIMLFQPYFNCVVSITSQLFNLNRIVEFYSQSYCFNHNR